MENNTFLEKRQLLLDKLIPLERKIEGLQKRPVIIGKIARLLKMASFFSSKPPVVKSFWGQKLHIYPLRDQVDCFHFFGALGFPEIKLIKFLIKNLKPDGAFYDVGASYGFYSALADFLLDNGEIHSFEPHPRVFQLLEKNARGFKNEFSVNNVALGNIGGEIDFYETSKLSECTTSFLVAGDAKKRKTLRVKSQTLDDYCRDHRQPSFIKLDAEGGETEIIKGGRETITKCRPVISLEIWPRRLRKSVLSLAAADLLRQLGYQSYYLKKNGDLCAAAYEELGFFSGFFDNYIFVPV